MLNPLLRALSIAFFMVVGSQQAVAHPHIWINAKADLLFDRNNSLAAIRHQWGFDEAFAAYATVGLDKNRDGNYSRRELAKLARVYVESIADFYYFTFVQMGDTEPDYQPVTDYWLEYENGQLTFFYTLPLQEPLEPHSKQGFSEMTITIFDPMYFANVEFAAESPVTLVGPREFMSACNAEVARPRELDQEQSRLLAEVGPEENIPAAYFPDISYLSNTITLACASS